MLKTTSARIVFLRNQLKLSQVSFSKRIKITQGALSQIENGHTQISIDTLRNISSVLEVNCNWLVNGKGAIFLSDDLNRKIQKKVLIPFIHNEAAAGYSKNYNNSAYIDKLDVYQIPGFESGSYRLFEVSGNSMQPTILSGEIVICEEATDLLKQGNGKLAIIVSNEGLFAKRVYSIPEDENILLLKSDNPAFETFTMKFDDIKEIWEIKSKITSIFDQRVNESERIEKLEKDLEELKKEIVSSKNKRST